MKWHIAHIIEGADERLHRLGWTPRWLCDAAECCYGCPPRSFNEGRPGGFARLMHRWLYGAAA